MCVCVCVCVCVRARARVLLFQSSHGSFVENRKVEFETSLRKSYKFCVAAVKASVPR